MHARKWQTGRARPLSLTDSLSPTATSTSAAVIPSNNFVKEVDSCEVRYFAMEAEQAHYGHVFLMGKTHLVMHRVSSNNAFDNFLMPDNLLLDTASEDLGRDYGARLLLARNYLAEHHPLARHLKAIAEVPGPHVDLNPIMCIEAQSLRFSAMELAFVSCGVQAQGGAVDRANKVVQYAA